jgi:predicted HTH transcriptional regulator
LDRLGYKREIYEPGIYEKRKLEEIMPYLPEDMRNEVINQVLSYSGLLEKYGPALKPFIDKAGQTEK